MAKWEFLHDDLSEHYGTLRGTHDWEDFNAQRRLRENRQIMRERQETRELANKALEESGMYFYDVAEHIGTEYLPLENKCAQTDSCPTCHRLHQTCEARSGSVLVSR
jgi:hypothetical protein